MRRDTGDDFGDAEQVFLESLILDLQGVQLALVECYLVLEVYYSVAGCVVDRSPQARFLNHELAASLIALLLHPDYSDK
jgi:hypothetical protein